MYLIDVPVKAWVPFRTTIWKDRIADCDAALARFAKNAPALLESIGTDLSNIEASIGASPPTKVLKALASRSVLVYAKQVDFLCVTAKFTLDRDKFNEENPDHPLDEDIADAFACLHLSDAIETLLVLSEISDPGRIDCAEGIAIAGSGSMRISAKPSIFQLWFPEKDDPTWPPLETIPLQDVLRWSSKTSLLKRALATTRVERILAAYTRIIHLSIRQEGEALFRAMQALEAFYCDGTGDLRKQLAEKSAIWLGPWNDKRNIVGHLYDMRSKFVHGSSKLQYWKDHADPWDEDEKHMSEFTYSVTLATRLVVATLQKCVLDQVHDIKWAYSVQTSSLGA